MRMTVGAVMLLGLSGCGVNFAGSYTGTLTSVASCSDHSGSTDKLSVRWRIVDVNGPDVEISSGGVCDPFRAEIAGNVGRLQGKTCLADSVSLSGIAGGEIVLDGPSLRVTMNLGFQSRTSNGNCATTATGTLTRE